MVSETQLKPNGLTMTQAAQLRQQAGELLERLISDREQSEKRFAEAGKRDPMKFITGRTALENAIASTREMISNMDALLARMNGEFDGELEPIEAANGRPQGRMGKFQSRNGLRHPAAAMAAPAGGSLVPVPVTGMP